MRRLLSQFARFGVVGAGGVVIDFVVFNVLRATVLEPSELAHGPLVAKIISTTLAIVFNWLGNRYWTFRHQKRDHWVREAVEFAVVSLGGMGIALGCLGISHYVLGFTDVVSDNIATNVVGLALGTAFRFTFYRLWVFRGEHAPAVDILGVELPADDIGAESTDAAAGSGQPAAVASTPAARVASASPSARSRRAPGPASADGAPQRG